MLFTNTSYSRGGFSGGSINFDGFLDFIVFLSIIVVIYIIYLYLKGTLLGIIFDNLIGIMIPLLVIWAGSSLVWFGIQVFNDTSIGGLSLMAFGSFVIFNGLQLIKEVFID